MQQYHVFRIWVWEILLVTLAFGLITPIAVLLKANDGKPVPDWGDRISFNAFLALLSTLLRATLVIVSSQLISQRKWEWYKNEVPRPLSDLQQFDAGSRGTLGALLLLPTIILRDVVTLVAIIILLASFLIGPFVQQASRTTECSFALPGPNASLPFAHYVPLRDGFNIVSTRPHGDPTQDLIAAVLSVAVSTGGIENRISPTCTTGRCTFPGEDQKDAQNTTHSTVGMCSKCIDISPLVYISNNQSLLLKNIPKEYNINGSTFDVAVVKGTQDLNWLGNLFTPDFRAISRWAYVNSTFFARGLHSGTEQNVTAAVCSLYPCLRTYIASITNNQLSEDEVRSYPLQIGLGYAQEADIKSPHDILGLNTLDNRYYHYTAVDYSCLKKDRYTINLPQNKSSHSRGTSLALHGFTNYGGSTPYQYTHQNITASEKCIYRQHAKFVQAVSMLLNNDLFNGHASIYRSLSFMKYTYGPTGQPGNFEDVGVEGILRALYNNGDTSFSIVTGWFDAFSDAMTNRFRFQYGAAAHNPSAPFNSDYASNETVVGSTLNKLVPGNVQGVAWQTTVCVSMRKEWLLLPLCLTIITTLLTMWTIATSWRHRHTRPVWKDSILPLVFCNHIIKSTNITAAHNETEIHRVVPSSRRHQPLTNNDDGRLSSVHHIDAASDQYGGDGLAYKSGLLETSEMKALGERISVTFRWLSNNGKGLGDSEEQGSLEETGLESPPPRQRRGWWRRRRQQTRPDVDIDSLLEPDE
ncbi:hypothetical protein PGQ11_015374 [Apiospora arundinis]|uniref:Uncharacterized protein n=1 Tax=Apiospora arundinis TaxID=335852 RepID=A0ABR2HMD5_9PEZI